MRFFLELKGGGRWGGRGRGGGENFLEILKIFLSRSGPKFKNQEQFDKQTYGIAFFKYILGTKYISGPFRQIKVFKSKWLPRGLKADLLAPRMKEMEQARRV